MAAAICAVVAGAVTVLLMLPRDCMSTLVGPAGGETGSANPNSPHCTGALGLPTNRLVAILAGLAVAAVVLVAMRRRQGRAGLGRRGNGPGAPEV